MDMRLLPGYKSGMSVRDLLQAAITLKGSQRALATASGYSQVAVCKALKKGRVSPGMAVAIEAATGIGRERLCPEVFSDKPLRRSARISAEASA